MSITGLQNSLLDLVVEIEAGMTKEQIRQHLIDLVEEI